MMMNAVMVMVMVMRVAIQNCAFHVKKSTVWIASLINNVICVGRISATNVKEQNRVRGWTVKINYVMVALKRRHAIVAAKLDVGIVPYLIFVITATAAKLFAMIVFIVGIEGVESAMVADWNFVPMTVETTYRNAVKKMGKAFVLIVHLRVRVCIDGRLG